MTDNYLLAAVLKLTQPYRTKVLQSKDLSILDAEGNLEASHSVTCIGEVQHEPLLLQLRDAIAGGIGKHAGSSAARERIPFDAGALELFDQIAGQINAWYRPLPNAREERHIHDRLNDWYLHFENQRRAGKIELETDRITTHLVEQWARQIEGMFDPPQTIEITAACPTCGARYAHDPKTGDQKTAVVIEYRELGEVTLDHATGLCRFCETVWRGRHGVRELRYAIDQAEATGDAA
jgi:hypothetical protein